MATVDCSRCWQGRHGCSQLCMLAKSMRHFNEAVESVKGAIALVVLIALVALVSLVATLWGLA